MPGRRCFLYKQTVADGCRPASGRYRCARPTTKSLTGDDNKRAGSAGCSFDLSGPASVRLESLS